MFRKLSNLLVVVTCLISWLVPSRTLQAEGVLGLPKPGTFVHTSASFKPVLIKGLKIDLANPLHFDFIVDPGDSRLSPEALRVETSKLIKYFLASLTVPEKDLWVNLSPYEQGRIIPSGLAQTDMGRDLLGQDYILKQLTASLMYPEDAKGKEFWRRVYQKTKEQYGSTNVPLNTFNKVWIVPDRAVVYERNGQANKIFALLGDSRLKVLLEQDYLALEKNAKDTQANAVTGGIVKEVLIPEIEREVNEGKNFYKVRQINDALILATWFKNNLKETLLGQKYANQNKVSGIDGIDKSYKEKIYNQYLAAFKKGVFNFIKEDIDPLTQKSTPRKYFSGGYNGAQVQISEIEDHAQFTAEYDRAAVSGNFVAQVDLAGITDKALIAAKTPAERLEEIRKSNYEGFPVLGAQNAGVQFALAFLDRTPETSGDNNPVRRLIRQGRFIGGPDHEHIIKKVETVGERDGQPTYLVSTETDVGSLLVKLVSQDEKKVQEFEAWRKKHGSKLDTLFLHNTGVIARPVEVFKRYGIFDLFKDKKTGRLQTITMKDIVVHVQQIDVKEETPFNTPNRQYIHGMLRALESLGWLTRGNIGDDKTENTDNETAYDGMSFTLTTKGWKALRYVDNFGKVANFMPEFLRIQNYLFNKGRTPVVPKAGTLKELSERSKRGWDIPATEDPELAKELRAYWDGYLVGNLALTMELQRVFTLFDDNLEISIADIVKFKNIPRNTDELKAAFDIFVNVGYLTDLGNGRYKKTEEGLVAFDRVLAHGVPYSYRPSYDLSERFFFGDVKKIERESKSGRELLVYRFLNVLGSGRAHTTYFKFMESIILNIINGEMKYFKDDKREELADNPMNLEEDEVYVLLPIDTGSGDGKWLKHVVDFIKHSDYGKLMNKDARYQVLPVSVDLNKEALQVSGKYLKSQGITSIPVEANVSNPAYILAEAEAKVREYYAARGITKVYIKAVQTQTFLMHNRWWEDILDLPAAKKRLEAAIQTAKDLKAAEEKLLVAATPQDRETAKAERDAALKKVEESRLSSGIYGWRGELKPNHLVEQGLVEFLQAWAGALRTSGQKDWVFAELFTTDSKETGKKKNIGRVQDVPYYLSHMFSDQFIIEREVFERALAQAGFKIVKAQYMPRNLTTVGIYHLVLADQEEVNSTVPARDGVSAEAPQAVADAALLAKSAVAQRRSNEGGINLDPNLGYVYIAKDKKGVPLPMRFQPVANIDLNGLQPVFLRMVPISRAFED